MQTSLDMKDDTTITIHFHTPTPTYDELVDQIGRQAILAALDAGRGSRAAAIAALHISERKLWRELERLDLWAAVDELHRRRGYPIVKGNTRRASNAGGELAPALRAALDAVLRMPAPAGPPGQGPAVASA